MRIALSNQRIVTQRLLRGWAKRTGAAVWCMLATSGLAGASEATRPLLMDGKSTIYKRVLTRPGAIVLPCKAPHTCLTKKLTEVPPMTIYYVYGEFPDGRLLVGPNPRGVLDGMVKTEQTVEWKQNIVLSFEQRANRDRVLFFAEQKPMVDFVVSADFESRQSAVFKAMTAAAKSSEPGLVSVEPEEFVDIQKQLYLLPILDATGLKRIKMANQTLLSGMVKVAAVSKTDPKQVSSKKKPSARVNPKIKDYRTAVVFVVDASGSMQRDIDSTREAAVEMLKAVEGAGLSDKVRFGLIGFRDDPEAVRGVGYLTRVFVNPSEADSAQKFLDGARYLSASPVSTRSWAEDGLAGVSSALNDIDWSTFGGRYVVYMSDASLRGATAQGKTPASATEMAVEEINALAIEKGVAIYSYHILTSAAEARGDVQIAAEQMKTLSRYPGAGSLYYGVASARTNASAYRATVARLAEALVAQVKEATAGNVQEPVKKEPEASKALTMQQKTRSVGRAMQLRYLGSESGATTPDMFQAWALNQSPRTKQKAFTIRLLMSRNQLNDLRETAKEVYDAAIASEFDPAAFMPSITTLAVRMGRDPELGEKGYAANLKDAQLFEFLDGLPYQSRAMQLIEDDAWMDLDAGEMLTFTDGLLSKIRSYERIYENADNWTRLHPADESGDEVYPMPLSLLP